MPAPSRRAHVTSRGDRREIIVEDDDDRHASLQTLGQEVQHFKGQVFLGDEHFVEKMQSRAAKHQWQNVQIPVAHHRPPPGTFQQIAVTAADRNVAIVQAHGTGAYLYQQIVSFWNTLHNGGANCKGCEMNATTLDLTLLVEKLKEIHAATHPAKLHKDERDAQRDDKDSGGDADESRA